MITMVCYYDSGRIVPVYERRLYIMMFLSNVCYHIYTVVFTYIRDGESWHEYWQLTRPRWTARESKTVWCELHDAILIEECDRATARVYECEVEQLAVAPCELLMRFSSTVLRSHYPEIPVSDRVCSFYSMRVRQWYLSR